jgi:glycerol-3-phosphate dehydrogenase
MTNVSAPLSTQRCRLLDRLAQPHVYDLAVIGGGATGLGVALDAAARGFSVVLVDSHDFAKGTSSRATKLVHGGVRYLAQGNISLVREALHERTTLLSNAPHLAQPLAVRDALLPLLGDAVLWHRPHDVRRPGRQGRPGATQFLGRERTLQCLPTARQDGSRVGVKYWDGQFDDARLALALARTAAAGALCWSITAPPRSWCMKGARGWL